MIQKLKTLNLCLLQIIGCIFVLSSIFKWIGLRTFAITVDDKPKSVSMRKSLNNNKLL